MVTKLIKNEREHSAALARISLLMDALPDTPEGDELELLATLVEAYERKRHPLPPSDPIEAIRFRMDQGNLKKKDLVPFIGNLSWVTEVLKGQRRLNLKMIRALHSGLGIPAESLLVPISAGTSQVRGRSAKLHGPRVRTA